MHFTSFSLGNEMERPRVNLWKEHRLLQMDTKRKDIIQQARIQRGDRGSGNPPPPGICQRWGLVSRFYGVGEGVQLLCIPYYYHFFWLASLASILQAYYRYTYFQVQCSVWNDHPFSRFPLSKLWKEFNFPSLALLKGIFLSRITWLKTIFSRKFSGREPQIPDTSTILKLQCTMSSVCLCREACNCTKGHPLPTINLYGKTF